MGAVQFHFIALGGRLILETSAEIVAHEIRILRRDEIRQRFADELLGGHAEQGKKPGIGEKDDLTVNQNRFVHRFHEALEELLAFVQANTAMFQAFQQFVDRQPKIADRVPPAVQTNPSGTVRVAGQPPDLLRQIIDGTILTLLPQK